LYSFSVNYFQIKLEKALSQSNQPITGGSSQSLGIHFTLSRFGSIRSLLVMASSNELSVVMATVSLSINGHEMTRTPFTITNTEQSKSGEFVASIGVGVKCHRLVKRIVHAAELSN
jgi:hypothetical protein